MKEMPKTGMVLLQRMFEFSNVTVFSGTKDQILASCNSYFASVQLRSKMQVSRRWFIAKVSKIYWKVSLDSQSLKQFNLLSALVLVLRVELVNCHPATSYFLAANTNNY